MVDVSAPQHAANAGVADVHAPLVQKPHRIDGSTPDLPKSVQYLSKPLMSRLNNTPQSAHRPLLTFKWRPMRNGCRELRKRESPSTHASMPASGATGGGAVLRGGATIDGDADRASLEDAMVDFSNASLYLSGLQTIFTICSVSVVSVLSCWLVPDGGVSAVRTLALCSATGVVFMRKPLRIGRAHGVQVIFSALQPSIAIYLLALVVEQLVHTCTSETTHAPSWRRVVFHAMMLLMLVSAMMRARHPLQDTDMPFLITASAVLVIAVLPPPAVALVGPLCEVFEPFA